LPPSRPSPRDDRAESILARYLAEREERPDLALDDWASRQPELGSDPDLVGRVHRLNDEWQRSLPELRRTLPTLPPGSAFFRRDRADREQPDEGELGRQLRQGQVLGDFRLVRFLARGGMGQVWQAEQLSLGGREVALKLVLPSRLDARSLDLFAREARAGGRLHHPGLVTVHGHGTSEGLAWIAMELVEGAWTLKDFLDETSRADEVPEGYDRQVARLVAEIADAMQAAHDAGVIHRDLKPQNVLITADDRPKVSDFGLARITDETALSESGELAGTCSYMSPEQVRASRSGIDHRTDVFSLGIVLYELLALRRPFEGDTTHQVVTQILNLDPPDLRTIRSKVPRDLAVIVGKALEKDRDKRFQTMGELAADLRRHLANEPILAQPPTRVERLVKWTRRNPAKSVSAGIASVTFTVIALLLAANVRTNRSLEAKTLELEGKTLELEAKSTESEGRRISAEQNEQRAIAGEQRAQEERGRAEQRADEVLRLSALQRLEDLTDEAERLWPAHPENIERYERWIEKAQALVTELPDHEAKLAEMRAKARPWTAEEQAEFRATHPLAKDLERLEREIAFWKARLAVLEGGEPGPEPTAAEVGVDLATLPADANGLNSLAWPLVDPKRTSFGGESKGLVLARRAMELAGEAERAGIRETLAWALFAHGRFDEAVTEVERALAETPELEGSLERLHAAIEADLEPEAFERTEGRVSQLEAELATVEGEFSKNHERTFDNDQDRWWHNQLDRLVNGIRAFADEETGLFSEGTSEEHGWGVKKRLANAVLLREGFAASGEHARAWARALPEIRAAYSGLALTPQLGLVPIGPDPESKLWEFAHLETGEPAVRGPDGKLVLREDTGLVFVLLPGGTFQMGAQRSDRNDPNYDPNAQVEGPVHEVVLSPFFLSKYEMTQGQWLRFAGSNPSFYRAGEAVGSLMHPVELVSWYDCIGLLRRLGLLLPTEAQWEYGARGNTGTVWWTGDEQESLRGAANLADQSALRAKAPWADVQAWPDLDDGYAGHAPVDAFLPNPFGLFNVHGNLWEWCLDGFDTDYYSRSPMMDPLCDPADSAFRIARGGAFGYSAVLARSASRAVTAPTNSNGFTGLRPARAIAR